LDSTSFFESCVKYVFESVINFKRESSIKYLSMGKNLKIGNEDSRELIHLINKKTDDVVLLYRLTFWSFSFVVFCLIVLVFILKINL